MGGNGNPRLYECDEEGEGAHGRLTSVSSVPLPTLDMKASLALLPEPSAFWMGWVAGAEAGMIWMTRRRQSFLI